MFEMPNAKTDNMLETIFEFMFYITGYFPSCNPGSFTAPDVIMNKIEPTSGFQNGQVNQSVKAVEVQQFVFDSASSRVHLEARFQNLFARASA